MKLLTNEQIKSLKEYKYHGGDLSLLYKYVLSPFAEFCVKYFTPLTIAPNAITLLGLISSFLSTILTFIYNPLLDTSCPRWLCIFTGFSILFYQTLDNMDGKQARRTNSSSPLGLLFDHGCDAINTGLLSVSMSSVFGTGWNIKLFLSFYIGFVTFYIQTWEEYYTGAMILPILNGPSDGLFLISIFSFFTSFIGSQFWQSPSIELPSQLNQVCNGSCRNFFNITTNSYSNIYYISPFQLVVLVGVFWATVIIVSQVSAVLGMIKNQKEMI